MKPGAPKRKPAPKQWMLTRDTRLESGNHQIDGYDIDGFPVRICFASPPGMYALEAEGDDE